MKMNKISIYTDGSCPPTTQNGGWAFIVVEENKVIKQYSGRASETTSNKMELTAIIESLKWLKTQNKTDAIIISDSQYCINGATKWILNWKKNGWQSANGPVKNKELWEELDSLKQGLNVQMVWVRGHDTCSFNNLADELAVKAGKIS